VVAYLESSCTLVEAEEIICLDRRFSQIDVNYIWIALCSWVTGGDAVLQLRYGDILRAAHDPQNVALLREEHRQALKRFTSLLEGRLLDEFGQPKLTLDYLRNYLNTVGLSTNATTLWVAVVEAAYGIYIRSDMGLERYGVPWSFIDKLIRVSPGTYRHIGATTQEVLRGWLESMS